MSYEIKLLELPDQPTLTIRATQAVTDLPQFFGRVYGSIMQYLTETGQIPTGMPFATYYNMDMQHMDVEAGFPVAEALPARGEIQPSQIPGGKFISTIHVGPYNSIEPAYNALAEWAKQNGVKPTGIAYEYYLNDPRQNPPVPAETEVRFPLK
jgi:effector-binding domain-containing protein